MYIKLDFNFLGIMVLKVGVLNMQEPNELLDKYHKTKLPGVIGWNLIKLAYEVFQKNMEDKALTILTAQQVLLHCCFPSFVYFAITKWVESSQYSHQYHWAGAAVYKNPMIFHQ